MNIDSLQKAKNIINEKQNRMKNFEKSVREEILIDEETRKAEFEKAVKFNLKRDRYYIAENYKTELDMVLNPRGKELYIDIDEVIADKERATRVKKELEKCVDLCKNESIGDIPLGSVNYYNDSMCDSYSKYPQAFCYLIPHYDYEQDKWFYDEKILYLPEAVNYVCEFINKIDRKRQELKK